MIAIGIMSGTSCDGADAIAIELESADHPHEARVVAHAHEPYPEALQRELLAPALLTAPRICELHYALSEIYAKAALALRQPNAEVVGMHGQTLWHAPPSKHPGTASTLQIGSSAVLAHRLGIPVVGDLRGADIAEGGEGAPIVPFTHWFFTPPERRPRLVVNIGGIANVTAVHEDVEHVAGYDVGPGMMIADAFARRVTEGRLTCDRDGELSSNGRIVDSLVARITEHPFVRATPPKSTGREDFGEGFYGPLFDAFAGEAAADVMKSILRATAVVIADAARREKLDAADVALTGGGAKNPTLFSSVGELLPNARVHAPSGVLAPQHHEPAAVALIAARTLARLPSSLPRVTGARRAAVLGHVHFP
jgi:anhydro-N-acetylmuramic acid kinase